MENTAITTYIPVKLSNDSAWTKKLTKAKQKKVIEFLYSEFNLSKAASLVGVTRRSLERKIKDDPIFSAAYEEARQHHLDNCESTMFVVASEPSRDGFNDRKLALQAHRPQIYNPKQEVEINQQVTVTISTGEIRQVLGNFSPGRELEAKYTIIEEGKAD